MTISAAQFRAYVVNPALNALVPAGVPFSQVASDLLMATAAVETNLGSSLVQQDGPALGVFQIEPVSLGVLLANLSPAQRGVLSRLKSSLSYTEQLPTNLLLAAAICRLFYWQVPEPLPEPIFGTFFVDPVTGRVSGTGYWGYYKRFYNTAAGATTIEEFALALALAGIHLSPGEAA